MWKVVPKGLGERTYGIQFCEGHPCVFHEVLWKGRSENVLVKGPTVGEQKKHTSFDHWIFICPLRVFALGPSFGLFASVLYRPFNAELF